MFPCRFDDCTMRIHGIDLDHFHPEWGAEMSWELYHVTDGGDQLLATYQGEMDNASSSDVVCLEDGCYYFLLLDSWGDGWNGGTLTCEPAIPGFVQDVTLYAGASSVQPERIQRCGGTRIV